MRSVSANSFSGVEPATIPAPAGQQAETAAEPAPANPLVWDAMEKILTPKPGETNAGFQFTVTNNRCVPALELT